MRGHHSSTNRVACAVVAGVAAAVLVAVDDAGERGGDHLHICPMALVGGAVLGGLLVGWLWLIVESLGPIVMSGVTASMADGPLKAHLVDSAQHMRLLTLGIVLLLVLRFSPRGLIPEK